jgi:hypothetical protein
MARVLSSPSSWVRRDFRMAPSRYARMESRASWDARGVAAGSRGASDDGEQPPRPPAMPRRQQTNRTARAARWRGRTVMAYSPLAGMTLGTRALNRCILPGTPRLISHGLASHLGHGARDGPRTLFCPLDTVEVPGGAEHPGHHASWERHADVDGCREGFHHFFSSEDSRRAHPGGSRRAPERPGEKRSMCSGPVWV